MPASMRVKEAAEGLLTVIIEHVVSCIVTFLDIMRTFLFVRITDFIPLQPLIIN